MMGPLIDNELERVDRKHAQLTQLSADLVEALNLYHTLMREQSSQPPQVPFQAKGPPFGIPPSPAHVSFRSDSQQIPCAYIPYAHFNLVLENNSKGRQMCP